MTYKRTIRTHQRIAPCLQKTESAIQALANEIYGKFKINSKELRHLAQIQSGIRLLMNDMVLDLAKLSDDADANGIYAVEVDEDEVDDEDDDTSSIVSRNTIQDLLNV